MKAMSFIRGLQPKSSGKPADTKPSSKPGEKNSAPPPRPAASESEDEDDEDEDNGKANDLLASYYGIQNQAAVVQQYFLAYPKISFFQAATLSLFVSFF